jgi:hypothetical protein
MDQSFYATPGPLTVLTDQQIAVVRNLNLDPEGVCRVVQGLLVQPGDVFGVGMSQEQLAERNTRPVSALLQRALELDPRLHDHARTPESRVVGTCRHYAVLATAMLQATDVPARARCGFASYFVPLKHVDHWITEYWSDGRWIRIDSEILGSDLVARPHDLRPGEFLTGGEGWQQVRAGNLNGDDFGVTGTENWGPGEIRGNAMRDLAALNKIEMLPWDEWGPMEDSYNGKTGDDFDRLIDDLAIACDADDRAALQALYERLPVPEDMIR